MKGKAKQEIIITESKPNRGSKKCIYCTHRPSIEVGHNHSATVDTAIA